MLRAQHPNFNDAAFAPGREPYAMAIMDILYGPVKTPTVDVSSIGVGYSYPFQINQGYLHPRKETVLIELPNLEHPHLGWKGRYIADTTGTFKDEEIEWIELRYQEPIEAPYISFWGSGIPGVRQFTLEVYMDDELIFEHMEDDYNLPYWTENIGGMGPYNKVILRVRRIHQRGGNVHLLFFGPIHRLIYLPSTIIDFSLLEDLVTPGKDPLGEVNANELDIALENYLDWFTPGNEDSPFKDLFYPKMKVQLLGGFKVEPTLYELIPLGTFYTAKWTPKRVTKEIAILCYDRLEQILNLPLPPVPVLWETSLEDFLRFLFGTLGLVEDEDYVIDGSIYTTPRICWTGKQTYGEAFQDIALAGGFYINCRRDGKIFVQSNTRSVSVRQTFTDKDMLRATTVPNLYRNSAVIVEASYSNPEDRVKTEVWSTEIELDSFEYFNINDGKFSTPVGSATEIAITGKDGAGITQYKFGAQSFSLEVANHTDQPLGKIRIAIYGDAFSLSSDKVTVGEDVGAGETVYGNAKVPPTQLSSTYFQSSGQAMSVAYRVLNFLRDPKRETISEWRADPRTELGDRVNIINEAHKVDARGVTVRSLKLRYNGGFTGELVTQREGGMSE